MTGEGLLSKTWRTEGRGSSSEAEVLGRPRNTHWGYIRRRENFRASIRCMDLEEGYGECLGMNQRKGTQGRTHLLKWKVNVLRTKNRKGPEVGCQHEEPPAKSIARSGMEDPAPSLPHSFSYRVRTHLCGRVKYSWAGGKG